MSIMTGPTVACRLVTAVECSDLVIRYGNLTAVDGLSLHASAGEVVVVLGPNGAGKTSTIESLEGYRRPSSGRVRVLGLDPIRQHRSLVPRIGVMLQRGGVYPMLGPRRVLRLFADYYADAVDPDALLDLVSLTGVAGTPWRHLSGGEQQRLSLALALVGKPQVVFLDEPTSGVDPEGRLAIREVVARLKDKRVSVLLTTHELVEAEHMADRVVVINRGQTVAEGTARELATMAGGPAVVTFGAPPGLDTVAFGAVLGAAVREVGPGRYRVETAATPALMAALATWLAERDAALTDLQTGNSLEEAYLAVVGETIGVGPEDETRPSGGRRRRVMGSGGR
jgi:ABC-2 type transport system ATP-binding protein